MIRFFLVFIYIYLAERFTKILKEPRGPDRRVARIWKRGGYFERVRSVQTTLTRIFIALESVSHGLHENWDEISRKFKAFFRPKSGGLRKKKKKKGLETEFSAKITNSKLFFAQNQVVSKKKGLHRFWDWLFGPTRKSKRLRGGCFPMGGAIFNFLLKIDLKTTKKVRFCILHKPMGGARAPPRPAPPPGYATGSGQ